MYLNIEVEQEITLDQLSDLINYFETNMLIVDCLNVANVSDREALLTRILTIK